MPFIRITFITAGVRNHKAGRQPKSSDQLNGVFDPLAPHYSGWLQKEVLAFLIQIRTDCGRRRRVWAEGCRNPSH
jgi:hypothetical protein